MVDPRTPVLVGVGTSFADAEAVELMIEATIAAARDAGAEGILAGVERVVVPRGTWSYTDPARLVAERIGAPDATTVLVDVGIPQQTLVDEVMAAMLSGALDVAVVVGAEAKARSARARRHNTSGDRSGMASLYTEGGTEEAAATETDQHGLQPDVHQQPVGDLVDRAEIDAGLWAPVEQYAMIESALGAAEGASPQQLQRDIAELYQRFNDVAVTNPDAAFPSPRTAADLTTFSVVNRPLAFPYAKWHATHWTVDQGAALLLCTAEAAERFGVPRDRWVFPLVGLSSSHMVPLSRRRDIHRWPAMRVIGEAAASRLGNPVSECAHAELYSCFPVAVRVQQRELGMPTEATPTVTGGMSFAGGPFNSFVLQATATMVHRLRQTGGRGVVTSVSGFLTKPGLGVWSTEPDGEPPLVADLADEVASATATVTVVLSHDGPATVVAYTVTFDGMDPTQLVALLDTPEGDRVIGRSADPDLIEAAMTTGIVGRRLELAGNTITRTATIPGTA